MRKIVMTRQARSECLATSGSPNWLMLVRLTLLCVTAICGLKATSADIRLPKIFSDSMVLQRQAEVHVYGLADPNEKLTITLSGKDSEKKELKTSCNPDGKFSVNFPPPPVGGPYELSIVGNASSVIIRDILVGDVWLCSGQSNMEWPLSKSENGQVEVAAVDNPQLRFLTIEKTASPQPLEEFPGTLSWANANPESAKNFPAVGFYFGQQVQTEVNVPIGLINASWGGTLCEAWTSKDALASEPKLQKLVDFGESAADGSKKQDRHSFLFNGMISPLKTFPIKGVIWYQGESNVGRGQQYSVLFPTMINDWRHQLHSPQMPFLFVQLAPFRYQNHLPIDLPELWEAQLNTLKHTPHTGMVVTTDLGNPEDIHPVAKAQVGRRLATWAMAEVYGDQQLFPHPKQTSNDSTATPNSSQTQAKVDSQPKAKPASAEKPEAQTTDAAPKASKAPLYHGPIYKEFQVAGKKLVLHFHGQQQLSSSDNQPLREFSIAGDDHVFYPAQAVIMDGVIHVGSPEVTAPIAARFAWTDTPSANLVNETGMPASPFRTDDFPLNSVGKDY